MLRLISFLLPKSIKKMIISFRKMLTNFKILSMDYGQYRTINEWNCIDKNGFMIPWYTYPAIEYLNSIDFSNKSVFEFGSGNSSKYWSEKAKIVTSVEHDKEWFNTVCKELNSNQEVFYREDNSSYEKTICDLSKKHDVVIIDGIRRPECSKEIGNFLNFDSEEGCMVILDNSDWYKDTALFLRSDLDMIEVDFHGFGPINSYTWTTSIFISRNFKFKPKNHKQPSFSIGALEISGECND